MRHIAVTFSAVVLLTLVTALPVASFGLTQVRLSCDDGTNITAEVGADTLAGLVQAVEAMVLYPAGLTCTLTQLPLFGALGGVASAGELRGGFVVGGGRLLYPCPNGSGQFWVNFAVSAQTETAAAGNTNGGTLNFTIPDGQCVSGHLTSKPVCLGIDTPGAQPPAGPWYAYVRSFVTQTTGSHFAPYQGSVISSGWKDTGNPDKQTSPDRVAVSGSGQCPTDHSPDPDGSSSVPILNGGITIHVK